MEEKSSVRNCQGNKMKNDLLDQIEAELYKRLTVKTIVGLIKSGYKDHPKNPDRKLLYTSVAKRILGGINSIFYQIVQEKKKEI